MKSRTVETAVWLMLAVLICGLPPAGAQQAAGGARPEAPPPESPPSVELLEFLGAWETDEGRWIDPMLFDPMPATRMEMEDETQEDE
jgi:hypothetical protein